MKIAIIGASGKAGRLIMHEAIKRGHEVVAIVRDSAKVDANRVDIIEKNIFNLTGTDLVSFDVVVDAFSAPQGLEKQHQTSLNHLIEILAGHKTRLLVVGGAGSLYVDDQLTVRVIDTPEFPEAYRPVGLNMAAAFDQLKASKGVNWTYLSPAAFFNPEGERTGVYVKGGDRLLVNSHGESSISYADYAIAMVDEIENHHYHNQRFSVCSV